MFRQRWGDASLVVGNVEELEAVDLDRQFDVVVAGELIEHLNNPGRFLRGVRRFVAPHGRLILTTPNAFGVKFFMHALAGRDRSHPDHALLFSVSTLQCLLTRHGFQPLEWVTSMELFETSRNRATRTALRWLCRRLPMLAETLVVVAGLGSEASEVAAASS
jgi:2-polyprenyl-3-methyl-5-hydroxy-6-metoxy-1,4-benzoquinol methylase